MADTPIEQLAAANKDGAEALSSSVNATISGISSLTKAYQDLAARNVEKLNAAAKALSSVKTPAELFEVQQRLAAESFQAAVADGKAIAELTTAVFTASFGPLQKQIKAAQQTTKK